jgi:hypothetical protein
MKKFVLLFAILIICHLGSYSQNCIPEGITFERQSQIDSFKINHPGCTSIIGNLNISGPYITNLNGLNMLTSISGDLIIKIYWSDSYLNNLTGLDNLSSVGESLIINGNHRLISLTGLGKLKSIGGELLISYNEVLTNLSGLGSLTTVGGNITIGEWNYGNHSLASLDGLVGLTSIGGKLSIIDNIALTSLSGLEHIKAESVTGLTIIYNNSLSDCEIENICNFLASPNGTIEIHHNASGCNNVVEVANACGIKLTCLPYGNYYFYSQNDIDVFSSNFPGCVDLHGEVFISGNDITNLNGLNAVNSIEGGLDFTYNPSLTNLKGLERLTSIGGYLLLYHNDALGELTGLENLNYIGGDFLIGEGWDYGNPSLTNLTGLNKLSTIGGFLYITNNTNLVNLTGLENLSYIGGELGIFDNPSLTSLTGLVKLDSIGGDLSIGAFPYIGNPLLSSLAGLDNLTSIGGGIFITKNSGLVNLTGLENLVFIGGELQLYDNRSLTNLSGIKNIDYGSITKLTIISNISLSECEVKSICDYLGSPDVLVELHDNAPGCISVEEVKAACGAVGIENLKIEQANIVFPNPFSESVFIEYELKENESVLLTIFNHTGQKVAVLVNEPQGKGMQQIIWNSINQPAGVYYCRLQTGKRILSDKIIKLK